MTLPTSTQERSSRTSIGSVIVDESHAIGLLLPSHATLAPEMPTRPPLMLPLSELAPAVAAGLGASGVDRRRRASRLLLRALRGWRAVLAALPALAGVSAPVASDLRLLRRASEGRTLERRAPRPGDGVRRTSGSDVAFKERAAAA